MKATHLIDFLRTPVIRGRIPSVKGRVSKPQVLWIGCSSSNLQDMQVLGLQPEEILVHRNVGNLVSNNDLSIASEVEYALKVHEVQHIVVCGHYNCQFSRPSPPSPMLAAWLKDVNDLYEANKTELAEIKDSDRNRRFSELHVWNQTRLLAQKDDVKTAMSEKGVKVHAYMFDTENNQCVELEPRS